MPQRQIHTAIDIAAPPELVWDVLTDWSAYPRWNPFIVGLHGRLSPGARLVVTVVPGGGRHFTFRPRLVELEPGRSLAWQGRMGVPGLFDGRHYFQVEALADGACRLIHGEDFSGLLSPLLRGALLDGVQHGFDCMNQALKTRAQTLASLMPA